MKKLPYLTPQLNLKHLANKTLENKDEIITPYTPLLPPKGSKFSRNGVHQLKTEGLNTERKDVLESHPIILHS